MTALYDKAITFTGALLLFIFTAIAAYLFESIWLFVPVGIILSFILLQRPAWLFYVLLCSIPWSTEFLFSFGLGTDLPDEPLMLLMAFASILLCLVQRQRIFRTNVHPILFLLVLQFLWLAITVITSTHVLLSLKYFLAKTWYLLAFVAAPLLLWKDTNIFKRSVTVLFVSMLGVTCVALVRHARLEFSFAQINEALAPFFRNHVNYSALLVFMVPLQVAIFQTNKSKRWRILLVLSFFITLPALYFSFARGAWLALLTGCFSLWLLKKQWLLGAFIFGWLIVAFAIMWLKQNNRYVDFAHDYQTTIFHENFQEHLAATYQLKDMSTAERFYRWIAGVRMVEDSWQTGFGPTTFYQHYKSYTVPVFKTWVSKNREQSTVHNYFLLLLIEQGVIALLLFLALIATAFWYAQRIYHQTTDLFWKRTVAAIAVVLVMQCTLNFLSDLIETDKVGSVFYLCFAALIIADKATRNKQHGFA